MPNSCSWDLWQKTSAEEQSAYFRIWIGETGRRIFKSWNLTEQDSKNADILFNKFDEYTAPKKNTVFSLSKFQERKQQQGETFETFVTDLRNLVKDCNYDKPSEIVHDRIVAGILSQDIWKTSYRRWRTYYG